MKYKFYVGTSVMIKVRNFFIAVGCVYVQGVCMYRDYSTNPSIAGQS